MQDEPSLPLDETSRSPRKIAHAFLDIHLHFISDNYEIRNWFGVNAESLAGCSLTEVFPELTGHEDRIQNLSYDPDDCFVQPEILRRSADRLNHYYDLEIVSGHQAEHALWLSVMDVTQRVLVSHRLQEIKNIPALKTTPEEIRRNLDALEQWNRALFLLNQAGQVLTATLDMEQVLEQLLEVALELIGAEGSSVWLWDDMEPEYLVCKATIHKGRTRRSVKQRLHMGQGLAGWVAETGKSVAIISAEDDPRFSPVFDDQDGFKTVSLLVVPLRARDETMGVLEVVNKLEGDFETDDLAVAETLAASASIAIDNARLVEALQNQTEDLRARNEELDAFAHTVAHDLQNPLSQIIGFAKVLQWDREGMTDDERAFALKIIANNSSKMSTIVHELLMLSSVRKMDVELKPLAMQSIVEAALERIALMVDEFEAVIVLPKKWPKALGHAAWIEEIWENYLSNALKYGGRPPRVELGGTVEPDGMVRFWVRDNGPGLSPEDQARLFTPFTKLGVNGHGLGLSIVRRIASKLGGQVGVESKVGEGSVFSFTLPGGEDSQLENEIEE